MKAVVSAAQMRAIDAETISGIGIPGAVLMENAGRAVAAEVRALTRRGPVAVVCGGGNNGGDGFVIARVLGAWGVSAAVFLAADPAKLQGDARLHFEALSKVGGSVHSIATSEQLAAHRDAILGAEVVVDAVFGTGLDREVGGHYRQVVSAMADARGVVVAVDIPSGLSADTGQVLGVCPPADITVTMAFHKPATASAPGFAHCGRVVVAEIGIPVSLAAKDGAVVQLVEDGDLRSLLPPVHALDYKNRRGHLLVVGGSDGKRGAARLAARAGLRAGAGLVTLAADRLDEAVDDSIMTAVAADGAAVLAAAAGKSALALGPGMDAGQGGRELVDAILAEIDVPVVIDADGLNHLAGRLAALEASSAQVILTPHPGEAARLLGCTSAEIEADRVHAARRLAAESGAVCVLKGARSLVACGDSVYVIGAGGPALATAGSGDVLTGVIAALAAQGLSPRDAALVGCFMHGRAGEIGGARLGDRGLLSSDLPELVAEAAAALRSA